MSRHLVISHARCQDGFCSAWIAQRCLPNPQILFANHGEAPPDVSGRIVHIIDFSYPLPVLKKMAKEAVSILVLDHHVTAMDALKSLPRHGSTLTAKFDMSKSGATMAWEHFYEPHIPPPFLVKLVEDRDLWKFSIKDSKALNAVLRSYKQSFHVWDELLSVFDPKSHKFQSLVSEGEAILRAYAITIADVCKTAVDKNIGGTVVPVANTTTLHSEIGEALAKGRPFSATWRQLENGRFQYALRSVPPDGVDVSLVALNFGGGGHKHSAGFVVDSIL